MFDFDQIIDRRNTHSVKWEIPQGQLPMWIADMDFETCPAVTEALKERADHGVFGYTSVPEAWYSAYIGWWERRHAFSMEREWLQFATGVVPIISCLIKRLTNVGDDVVLMTPVYNIFFHSVENAGRHVLECPLRYENGEYSPDFALLEETLARPLSTLLILCNPHNPTGHIWTREELLRIGGLCKKYGVLVISDEVHCDLTLPNREYFPFASLSEDFAKMSVTCLAPSKTFNLGGLQSAAVCVPDKRLREIAVRALNSDEIAEPNCFAAEAAVAAFTHGETWLDELRAYLAENRTYAETFLRGTAASPVRGEATYLLWLDCSAVSSDTDLLADFLQERAGVVLSKGSEFRGNGRKFLRMNLAYPRRVLAEGLSRIGKGLATYGADGKKFEKLDM